MWSNRCPRSRVGELVAAFAKVDVIKIFESQAVAASGCARQVRMYAPPVGTGHAFSFQQNLFPAHWMLFGKDGSGKLGTAGETKGIHVVLASSDLNGDSSSCSEALMVSQTIELGSDGHAVCGARFVKLDSTLLTSRRYMCCASSEVV